MTAILVLLVKLKATLEINIEIFGETLKIKMNDEQIIYLSIYIL